MLNSIEVQYNYVNNVNNLVKIKLKLTLLSMKDKRII